MTRGTLLLPDADAKPAAALVACLSFLSSPLSCTLSVSLSSFSHCSRSFFLSLSGQTSLGMNQFVQEDRSSGFLLSLSFSVYKWRIR